MKKEEVSLSLLSKEIGILSVLGSLKKDALLRYPIQNMSGGYDENNKDERGRKTGRGRTGCRTLRQIKLSRIKGIS